jgi:hypothetical protein
MADDTTSSFPSRRSEGPDRGNRSGAPREGGGFRIRLSDNEMQAARALQEAFGLRSTVAVLGFALRTLAQQLEQGQLQELVSQHRAQAGNRAPAPRDGERRRERPEGGREAAPARAQRVDPFARPSRPATSSPSEVPVADQVEVGPVGDTAETADEVEFAEVAAAESPAEASASAEEPSEEPSETPTAAGTDAA